MKRLLIAVWLMLFSAGLVGCYQGADGGWHLGMKEANQIEQGLDTAAEGLSLVSLFIPGAAGLTGIAAGLAGMFKKLKPELTKSKQVNEHVVTTIEVIKNKYPELWVHVKNEFKKGTNADIEEVINKIIAMQKNVS